MASKEEWVTIGIHYSLPIETLEFTSFSIKSTQSRHSFSKFSGQLQFLGKLIRNMNRKNYGSHCTIGPESGIDTHHLFHPAGLSILLGRLPKGCELWLSSLIITGHEHVSGWLT